MCFIWKRHFGGYIILFKYESLQDLNYHLILTVVTLFNPSDDQYQLVEEFSFIH